uniref:Uncharacterized protein n=1 Tax=Ignisphaera aggregans TaxID=334771 RepID=A0A7C5YYQ0_9CREN
MFLKNRDFSEIKRKAEEIRRVWEALSSKYLCQVSCDNVLTRFDFAPLIATICDEEIKTDYAWAFPSWLYEKTVNFDLNTLLNLDYRKLLEDYLNNKWPHNRDKNRKQKYVERISKSIINSLKFFKNKNITPVTMFENREYSVVEVYLMLRTIPGIGPKKAFMITRDFAYRVLGYTKCHSWFDQVVAKRPRFILKDFRFLDPPIDIHSVKVFSRLFGQMKPRKSNNWRNKITPEIVQDIHAFARLVFPDIPAKIDDLFWNIGREYCYPRSPKCDECPLRKICDIGLRSKKSSS